MHTNFRIIVAIDLGKYKSVAYACSGFPAFVWRPGALLAILWTPG